MRLFSNRSQMTSKCGKNKEVAHEPQASVSLMLLPHFTSSVIMNKATWNLFVLYNDQKRKKTDTHTCLVPLDFSKICASFCIFSKHISFLLLFFFTLLGYGFFETFFNVFFCSKQNNSENILQNSESRNDTRRQLLWRFLLSLGILKL